MSGRACRLRVRRRREREGLLNGEAERARGEQPRRLRQGARGIRGRGKHLRTVLRRAEVGNRQHLGGRARELDQRGDDVGAVARCTRAWGLLYYTGSASLMTKARATSAPRMAAISMIRPAISRRIWSSRRRTSRARAHRLARGSANVRGGRRRAPRPRRAATPRRCFCCPCRFTVTPLPRHST